MTEPTRPSMTGRPAADRSGTPRPGAAVGAAMLDDLLAQGHLADIDRHFAALVAGFDGGGGPELPLAAALASAWARDGHACIALDEVAGRDWPRAGAPRLPDLEAWIGALATSPVVARPGDGERRPLVLDDRGRLYLERLWTAERTVAADLRRLADGMESEPDPEHSGLEAALDRLFPGAGPGDRARVAARTAVLRRLCVVSGGPGTGKTTIAAAIVALLIELGLAVPGRIALAAPTGKAAARLQEAMRGRHRELVSRVPALEGFEAHATTVHRWLLSRARGGLPVDALVLDEGSMVDLTLMAKVLAALPGGARLVVLGDASQLASVQPGAVFADVCRAGTGAGPSRTADGTADPSGPVAGIRAESGTSARGASTRTGVDDDVEGAHGGAAVPDASPLSLCVVELVHNWRFDEAGGIGRLASAVVRGDASAAVAALRDPSDDATELRHLADAARFELLATTLAEERFVPALRAAQAMRGPGEGAGPLSSFRVLCAHRTGGFGAVRFNQAVERRLRALGLVPANDAFYPGRPILVTRNDPRTGLSNGDTGIVLRDGDGLVQVWFPELEDADGRPRLVSPARLPPHESFFAVTVHRAQGSEYDEVAVVPGPAESRVATRELLYTAVTRARRRVVVHGTEESVRGAVERVTDRASGLRDALLRPADAPRA